MKRQFKMLVLTILLAFFIGGCGSGGSSSGGGNPGGGVTIGIGTSGGSVTSSDKQVTIAVPAGAISQTMEITLTVHSTRGLCFSAMVTFTATVSRLTTMSGALEPDSESVIWVFFLFGYFIQKRQNLQCDSLHAGMGGFQTRPTPK